MAVALTLTVLAAGGRGADQVFEVDSVSKPVVAKASATVPVHHQVAPSLVVVVPPPDVDAAIAEDDKSILKGRRRTGLRIELPSPVKSAGPDQAALKWQGMKDGTQVAVFRIESPGALALRLHFEMNGLPPGGHVVVYNANAPDEAYGPYGLEQIAKRPRFWSESVLSDAVHVELVVPAGGDPGLVDCQVTEVVHRYRKLFATEADDLKLAGACNRDVTCSPDWVELSKAVSGLGSVANSGELFCTGCLLNDMDPATFNDYYLTANHCVFNQEEANDAEFYWFYQTPSCNGVPPAPGTVTRTSGGAEYLAGVTDDAGSDFGFLRLRQAAPGGVTYVGWTTAAASNNATVTTIHHPDGDFKRISVGRITGNSTRYWSMIWNSGTTEPGSSGAPLFNSDKKLIGQLHGGGASCSNPSGVDDYGRFDLTFPVIEKWLMNQPVAVSNDAFAQAQLLVGASGTLSGTTAGATKQVGEPNHAGNVGGKSVWFRWTAPADGLVTFQTLGSGFDTLLAVYTGNAVGSLTLVASNDDADADTSSSVTFTAVTGTAYNIAVDGYDGAAGPIRLRWQPGSANRLPNDNFAQATPIQGMRGDIGGVNFGATKEPGEPSHAENPGGKSVWFTWTAPANFQVRFDTETGDFDTLLAVYRGNAVGSLTPVTSNDDIDTGGGIYGSRVNFSAVAGQQYHIAVDGYGESPTQVESGLLTLTWYPATTGSGSPPANDAFSSPVVLNGNIGKLTNSNLRATEQLGEPDHVSNAGGRSVWYQWTAPGVGLVTLHTLGGDFDTLLAVYEGAALGSLTPVVANDDIDDLNRRSQVGFLTQAGGTYRIAVDGFRTSSGVQREGAVVLSWLFEPGHGNNDMFANAQSITGPSGQVYGANTRATNEMFEPGHAGNSGGKSVWFIWTAPASGTTSFDTAGSTFDTLLAVYTGSEVGSLTGIASNDDTGDPGLVSSRVEFDAQAGTTYRIAVDGYNNGGEIRSGSIVLRWEQTAGPELRLATPSLSPSGVRFTLTFSGSTGFQVQQSSNLVDWLTLSNGVMSAGQALIVDPAPGPVRFYRARTQP